MSNQDILLDVRNLTVEINVRRTRVVVLNNLSFSLRHGEILGIVGESGCGKTMTALSIIRLIPKPAAIITGGQILLEDEDLLTVHDEQMSKIRGRKISMVFQEPMSSLNPVFSIGNQLTETIRRHTNLNKKEAHLRAVNMMREVGIPNPEARIHDYPHQFSGGMRQRIMIAVALACNPIVMIADEPTTALDVTVQAQIFELMRDHQKKTGTSLIYITHDMGAVSEMCGRVLVMYAGQIMEEGPVKEILLNPQHPYTIALIACVPHIHLDETYDRPMLPEIPGNVPTPGSYGRGCVFEPRCARKIPRCASEIPPSVSTAEDHIVACWLYA